jgi:hypothetical protein
MEPIVELLGGRANVVVELAPNLARGQDADDGGKAGQDHQGQNR